MKSSTHRSCMGTMEHPMQLILDLAWAVGAVAAVAGQNGAHPPTGFNCKVMASHPEPEECGQPVEPNRQ